MNAKITIAVCMFVAAMSHASAAIVDVETELRAVTTYEHSLNDYIVLREIIDRKDTFLDYGSFGVSADAGASSTDVTARVQPYAINIKAFYSSDGSSEGFKREGAATATVNFNLSEAGVWSARPVSVRGGSEWGMREAEVLLLREGQEVYRQDCSFDLGFRFCGPYYGNRESPPNPYHPGVPLDLQKGDYTLFLTASEGTVANNSASGTFNFDLQVVPVPAALPLFLSGLAALGFLGWRRR